MFRNCLEDLFFEILLIARARSESAIKNLKKSRKIDNMLHEKSVLIFRLPYYIVSKITVLFAVTVSVRLFRFSFSDSS